MNGLAETVKNMIEVMFSKTKRGNIVILIIDILEIIIDKDRATFRRKRLSLL